MNGTAELCDRLHTAQVRLEPSIFAAQADDASQAVIETSAKAISRVDV